jgi:hypothetical protein
MFDGADAVIHDQRHDVSKARDDVSKARDLRRRLAEAR